MDKIEKEQISKDGLSAALTSGGRAVESIFGSTTSDGKIKGFKPHATGFLGYLIRTNLTTVDKYYCFLVWLSFLLIT